MKAITEKTGVPPEGYTDSQWQQDFIRIKSMIHPSASSKMNVIPERQNFAGTYHGNTQYQYYCGFINDILCRIRRGKSDYCYYIYQIAELLKYEHDRLQAVWLEDERCFKLNLTK